MMRRCLEKFVFYEALGHIISCEEDFQRVQQLLQGVLGECCESWEKLVKEIEIDVNGLKKREYIDKLVYILKVHKSLASAIGHGVHMALSKIYSEVLKLYSLCTQQINSEIETKGPNVIHHAEIKKMIAFKRSALQLIETYIAHSNDNYLVSQNFIPPLS